MMLAPYCSRSSVAAARSALFELRAPGTQQLIDAHDRVLRHIDELGGALEVLGQGFATGGAGDLGLLAQGPRRDAQIFERDAVLEHGIERDLVETLAALAAHDLRALLRQGIVADREPVLAHAPCPRKAISTSSGTAPSAVMSVSMA